MNRLGDEFDIDAWQTGFHEKATLARGTGRYGNFSVRRRTFGTNDRRMPGFPGEQLLEYAY